jgi:hypothetical protein
MSQWGVDELGVGTEERGGDDVVVAQPNCETE